MSGLFHSGDCVSDGGSFMTLAQLDQAALDAMPQAVYLCAEDGRVVRFNGRAVELWGRTPKAGDPRERFCGSYRLYRTDGTYLPHEECPMATALQTGQPFEGEVVVERPDGERSTLLVNIAAIKDQTGRISGALNCFQDITARKQAEDRQHHLVHELKHRIKNMIATVQSVAANTAHGAESMHQFQSRFNARLLALGQAHMLLDECEENGASLRDLVARLLEPFGGEVIRSVQLKGSAVALPPPLAFALCMLFHELITNAAKYGPLSSSDGRISVEWELVPSGERRCTLALHWSERDGPAVEEPERAGFGTRLIKRLVGGLGGQVEFRFERSGLKLRLTVPFESEEQGFGTSEQIGASTS